MTKTIKSYVKQVLAQLTGDQAAATAERNYRMSKAALKGQIASLQCDEVRQENVVSQKEENLLRATYPATPINDMEQYVKGVRYAQIALDDAKKDLENVKHSITYFNNLLESFDEEVKEGVQEAA